MRKYFQEIEISSSLDASLEPSLFFMPKTAKALLVGLHTWSADRFNQMEAMLPFCQERNWALLLPEFRGPNLQNNPRANEAGGSALARRDIVDATQKVIADYFETTPPVFLLGGSGGGHMSLQLAAREPFYWDAVSSWCPITDVASWHAENASYAEHIEAVCGGRPSQNSSVDHEYQERSPIHAVEGLQKVRLQLAHGRYDAAVPYSHSWKLAQKLEQIGAKEFFFMLFDGTHEMRVPEAFAFFDRTLLKVSETELSG